MRRINLNSQEGVKFVLYPDNQPHVQITECSNLFDNEMQVTCSITDSIKLMHLVEASNALDHLFIKKKVLIIPYLMGARFDRVMQYGDSFDLEVIANIINMCGFERVELFDVHSDVATSLIKNSVNYSNLSIVREHYKIEDTILICPDAGAAKKIGGYFTANPNIVDVVYCIKSRDLSNGNLTIKVLEPEKCKDRNCLIIDDICDGGGTFIGIAEQIQPKYLTLMVTHGIFSQGFKKLEKYFQSIVTTNSLCRDYDSHIVTKIKL